MAERITVRERIFHVLDLLNREFAVGSGDIESLHFHLAGRDVETAHLFRTKTVGEIVALLLEQKPIYEIVELLNSTVRHIIHDIPHVTDELELLNNQINGKLKVFGIFRHSHMIGRHNEFSLLYSILTGRSDVPDANKPLINVCGMAGIGKTFLIHHVAANLLVEGQSSVAYIDAKGLTTLEQLVNGILTGCYSSGHSGYMDTSQEPDIQAPIGSYLELRAILFGRFLNSLTCDTVIILDDLSLLLSNPNTACEVYVFLFDLLKAIARRGFQTGNTNLPHIKILITSQHKIHSENEALEHENLVKIKRSLSQATFDLQLEPMTIYESRQFFNNRSDIEAEELVSKCSGHPILLNLMKVALYDESISLMPVDLGQSIDDILLDKYGALFEKLARHQKLILLSLTVLSGSITTVEALYHTVGSTIMGDSELSLADFYAKLKRDFSSGFWISLRSTSDVAIETERRVLVSVFHPTILRFLQRVSEYQQYGSLIAQLEQNMANYFIKLLSTIGKKSLTSPTESREIFAWNRDNIIKALMFVKKHEMVPQMFPVEAETAVCEKLFHRIIALHHYEDSISNILMETLCELVDTSQNTSSKSHVVLRLVYGLTLSKTLSWVKLKGLLRDFPVNRLTGVASVVQVYMFCRAIDHLMVGVLKMNTAPEQIEHRQELDRSIKGLNKLKQDNPSLKLISNYFLIHCLDYSAHSQYIPTQGLDDARKAFKTSMKINMLTSSVNLLKYVWYGNLAKYKLCEGNHLYGRDASLCYQKADEFHNEAFACYKAQGLDSSVAAARSRTMHMLILRSWADVLAEETEKDPHRICLLLKRAIGKGKDAIRLLQHLLKENMFSLVKAYFEVALCLEVLIVQSEVLHDPYRKKYESQALRYYSKAYNLLKKDYRICINGNLSSVLNRMLDRLPFLLNMHGHSYEFIQKVTFNLEHIKQRLSAEADDISSLSGSDCPDNSSVDDLDELEELRLCQSAQSMDIQANNMRRQVSMEMDGPIADHQMPSKRRKAE